MAKIIDRFPKRRTVLLEWVEGEALVRAFVPEEIVEDGVEDFDDELLSLAIPYGVDLEDILVENLPDPEDVAINVAEDLHRMGIWTYEDLRMNMAAVQNVVMRHTLNANRLLRYVEERLKES